ncbi:peptidyl-prolyl cis-trans isomerase D [Gammaproteobacteria bacterium]
MMQSLRDKTQGWIAGIIAAIIALSFALWGIQNYLHAGRGTQVVAKVNGEKITQAQEQIAYEQLKRNEMFRMGQGFSFDQKAQTELKKTALQQLIKKEVISQAMNKMGFDIGQESLWAVVSGLPIFQKNGHFSIDYFRMVTERVFYSQQAFLDNFKDSLLQAQFERGVVESSFNLPHEIDKVKKLFKQRRDFGYFVVSPERFATTVQVEAAAAEKYYEQHHAEFTLPEKISIQYVELSSDALQRKVDTSEEQFKQYYHSHISSFSTPKKWQVTRVLLPLSQTVDAKVLDAARKKLVQIKAEDDLTKVAGVRTTKVWLTHNEVGVDLATQLDKLNVGQLSKPFRTKDGYSLIKILAIQPEIIAPYKSVAAKVKQASKHQQLAQFLSEANDTLVDLTYTNSDSLEPAAKALDLKIQTTDLVTEAGSKSGILASNKVLKAAFSEAVLKQGYNSNSIEIAPGKLVVLRIKDHIPEALQPLDKVRAAIEKKLKIQEMQKKAHDFSQELLAELHHGKAVDQLVKQYNFTWHVVTDADRSQNNKDAKLVEAAFDLNKLGANEVSATVVDLNGDYAVLQLLKVYDNQSHHNTIKETGFLKELPKQLGQFEYQLFIDNIMHKAKIKINEEVE